MQAGLAAAAMGLAPAARAIELVDLLLVLAADVSRSVDAEKFRLQREGYIAAISDPTVVRLMRAGPRQKVALCFVEWSGDKAVSTMVDWQAIGAQSEADGFAGKVRAAPRLFMDRTSISTGIDHSMGQLARSPYGAERRVIDVSGDGTHNSGRPVILARDEAVGKGVTINGIAILSAVPLAFNPSHTHPPGGLLKYYEDNVIGGVGAFALAAEGFGDFAQAIRRKLIKEIAAAALPRFG
jgi:hypothetical protein